jgi:hypothetical protein
LRSSPRENVSYGNYTRRPSVIIVLCLQIRPKIALTGRVVAGLLDAEGHFGIAEMNGGRSLSCVMRMAVRDDDADLLFALTK